MDLITLGALIAAFAFLCAIVVITAERNGPIYWALSWGILIATGILLALDPSPLLSEVAQLGSSAFVGLQLAGAYRYAEARVPHWVLPFTAVMAISRSAVAFAGYDAISHAAVLPFEIALLGWSAQLVWTRAPERRDPMDWLLALGAAALCGLEILDAVVDVAEPGLSVLWAPWLGIGAIVGMIQIVGVSERSKRTALERRRAFEERERTAQRLESLGVLAGGIAHDFNNLLTGIIGNAELALQEIEPQHPARPALENAADAALAAAELSGQMLAYASGRQLDPKPVDLSEQLRARAALLHSAVSSDVELQIDAPSGLPLIRADPSQIDQVIMNLTMNAGEACVGRKGLVRVSVAEVQIDSRPPTTTIGELAPGHFLLLSVQDNGCGLDPETASGLFDPFFSTKFSGRGMGLAVAQRIVRAHQGAIAVDSRPSGTVFDVYFPVGEALELENAPPPLVRKSQRACILIVDDDTGVLEVARRALTTAGHEIIAVDQARDAIALLSDKTTEPVLLLLDATMPGVGAREVIACARSFQPGLPILMMTGHDTERLAEELSDPEIVGWLRKPFRLRTLRERVERSLARR